MDKITIILTVKQADDGLTFEATLAREKDGYLYGYGAGLTKGAAVALAFRNAAWSLDKQ